MTLAETSMNVRCIAHTALSDEFYESFDIYGGPSGFEGNTLDSLDINHRAAVALTAIRTCYSANKPSEIVSLEGSKYFGRSASDGEEGTEADRLFRHIVRSGHKSTLEHLTYTFVIEGVSRSLLAQLTRHRQFSFSVQSQRYVKFGSGDRSGGFDYVAPQSIAQNTTDIVEEHWGAYSNAYSLFETAMEHVQYAYDALRAAGISAEDARAVLPNAAATNLVMTANLRALIEFYGKRQPGHGAQAEIATLSDRLKDEITRIDPWTKRFFEEA